MSWTIRSSPTRRTLREIEQPEDRTAGLTLPPAHGAPPVSPGFGPKGVSRPKVPTRSPPHVIGAISDPTGIITSSAFVWGGARVAMRSGSVEGEASHSIAATPQMEHTRPLP